MRARRSPGRRRSPRRPHRGPATNAAAGPRSVRPIQPPEAADQATVPAAERSSAASFTIAAMRAARPRPRWPDRSHPRVAPGDRIGRLRVEMLEQRDERSAGPAPPARPRARSGARRSRRAAQQVPRWRPGPRWWPSPSLPSRCLRRAPVPQRSRPPPPHGRHRHHVLDHLKGIVLGVRSRETTPAPSLAARMLVDLPTPDAAPVTTAALQSSRPTSRCRSASTAAATLINEVRRYQPIGRSGDQPDGCLTANTRAVRFTFLGGTA